MWNGRKQEELKEFFGDACLHFAIPGMTNFIGRLSSDGSHQLGEGWIRLQDPVIIMEATQEGERGFMLSTLGGPHNHYVNYVDFFIPPDRPVEIRTLDQEGNLYKLYRKEVNAPKRERIISPHEIQ